MRNSAYTILIICEGENTEPFFFQSIKNRIIKKVFDLDIVITIIPEPKTDEEIEPSEIESVLEHKKKREKRSIKKAITESEPVVVTGKPPLKWVLYGQEEIKSGAYDEVWAVFDDDEHPAKQEAFEASSNEIKGKRVKIAYSSRSFEYYILLHFNKIYKRFQKTDCKETIYTSGGKKKKDLIYCGSNINPKDCGGEVCINGYARKKNYWDNSKSKESMFNLIQDKLILGFERSAWLRYYSNIMEGEIVFYNRNPYLSTDSIVKRLTGYDEYTWVWVSSKETINEIEITILNESEIELKNNSSSNILISKNSFYYRMDSIDTLTCFGSQFILGPGDSKKLDMPEVPDDFVYFGFEYEKHHALFDFKSNEDKIKSIIQRLLLLTHRELSDLKAIVTNRSE